MIRFACPACNSIMTAPDRKAGQKFDCLKCGQRLQVPAPAPPPARNRTILGSLMAPFRRRSPAAPAPVSRESVPGRPLTVPCSGCGQLLQIATSSLGGQVRCPKCKAVFTINAAPSNQSPEKATGPAPDRRARERQTEERPPPSSHSQVELIPLARVHDEAGPIEPIGDREARRRSQPQGLDRRVKLALIVGGVGLAVL